MTISRLGMTCPTCHLELKIASREGVEIDYCPECRGVWLERGELDKIIDRVVGGRRDAPPRDCDGRDEEYADDRPRARGGYRKKKKSFLAELFDFD